MVTADVTEKEYQILKECCGNDEEIDMCDGLEDLCRRIEEAAQEEKKTA